MVPFSIILVCVLDYKAVLWGKKLAIWSICQYVDQLLRNKRILSLEMEICRDIANPLILKKTCDGLLNVMKNENDKELLVSAMVVYCKKIYSKKPDYLILGRCLAVVDERGDLADLQKATVMAGFFRKDLDQGAKCLALSLRLSNGFRNLIQNALAVLLDEMTSKDSRIKAVTEHIERAAWLLHEQKESDWAMKLLKLEESFYKKTNDKVGLVFCMTHQRKIQDDQEVTSLISTLESGNDKARITAAGSLGQLGLKAQKAIPNLIKAISNRDNYQLAEAAQIALAYVAPELYWRYYFGR